MRRKLLDLAGDTLTKEVLFTQICFTESGSLIKTGPVSNNALGSLSSKCIISHQVVFVFSDHLKSYMVH